MLKRSERLSTRYLSEVRDRYGETALLQMGPFRVALIHNPEDIHHVLVQNARGYVKSRSYRGLALSLGSGLLTSEGELWRRQRRLSQPAFHPKRLEALCATMVDCIERWLETWERRSPASRRLDLHTAMLDVTLSIVGHTLFGLELGGESGQIGAALTCVAEHARRHTESLVRPPLWFPTPFHLRYHRSMRLFDDTVHEIIRARRRNPVDRGDLLSMLMAATGDSGTERMTDAQLRDEVMTFLTAGWETVAIATSWTFLALSQHANATLRVRQEISRLGDRRIEFSDLAELNYLNCVIQEAMRLYPPIWLFEREALEDDTLGGYRIPKGTIVAISPWTIHRSPLRWSEPERFDPDRFSPSRSQGRSRYAFIPFGAGPRICIGNQFAMMEAKLILAMVLRRFHVDVVTDPAPMPNARLTLRPFGGMPARISPRDDL